MEAGCVDLQRRQLLRGAVVSARWPVRPPWAVPEARFADLCTRCDRCRTACGERLIRRGSGAYPEVDFSRAGCTLCGACLRSCETGALPAVPAPERPWRHGVRVLANCLAARGVVCRSCADACPGGALRFQLRTGGRAVPLVSPSACNGCGACLAPCPVQAVALDFSTTEPGS